MKKYICILFIIAFCILSFSSCSFMQPKKTEPFKVIEIKEPLKQTETGFEYINEGGMSFSPLECITFNGAKAELYRDEELNNCIDDGIIIPGSSEETYYILAYTNNGESKSFKLLVHNYFCSGISVEVLFNKEYGIGDIFDKSSVIVKAVINDEERVVYDYDAYYDFSKVGTNQVRIEYCGYVEKIDVNIIEKGYLTLDDNLKSGNGLEFEYNEKENAFYIKSGKDFSGYLNLPEYIIYKGKEYKVCGILDYAFSDNNRIIGVICNTPYIIGEGSFKDCSKLKECNFTNGCTFSPFAFDGCYNLVSFSFPSDLTEIPYNMFSYCDHLSNFSIPNTVKIIGSQAFLACESITYINLPRSLETLGARAFKNCTNLKYASVSVNATFIGDCSFSNCENLEILVLPALATYEGTDIILGSEKVTVYTGKGCSLIYYMQKENIPYEVIPNNTLYIINEKETYNIQEDLDESKIQVISYYDDDISVKTSFECEYNFKYPGSNTVTVYCGDKTGSINVFVEYSVDLYDDVTSRGERFSVDLDNKTATLEYLPSDIKYSLYEGYGTYILPTSVVLYGTKYTVNSLNSGAITNIESLNRLILPSTVTTLYSGCICNCENLNYIYISTPIGTKYIVEDGNFENLGEDLVIMCTLKNSSMHNYVRKYNIKYCGLKCDCLYVFAQKGAKTKYTKNETFDKDNYYCIFLDEDYNIEYHNMDELRIEYNFDDSNVVRFRLKGYMCEYKVNISE